jgi:nicotinamide-nucleotide amidase
VRLRLSARGTDKEKLEEALEANIKSLDAIIHDIIVGYEENETIESVVGKLLSKENKTISTAESFTGGKIASILSAVPGASNYFKGSIVSYATEAKVNVLGVSQELVNQYSVVSAQVAEAMALNVKDILKTDYAIATTGNAGPSKGDSDAEIGAVFIALATPNGVITEEFNFGQPREKVIDRATIKSLEILQKEILKIVQ